MVILLAGPHQLLFLQVYQSIMVQWQGLMQQLQHQHLMSGEQRLLILSPLLAGYLFEQNPALIYPLSFVLILFVILVSVILIPQPTQPEHIPLATEN